MLLLQNVCRYHTQYEHSHAQGFRNLGTYQLIPELQSEVLQKFVETGAPIGIQGSVFPGMRFGREG